MLQRDNRRLADQLKANANQSTVSLYLSFFPPHILTQNVVEHVNARRSPLLRGMHPRHVDALPVRPVPFPATQPDRGAHIDQLVAQFGQLRAHILPGLSHRLVQHDPKPTRPIRHAWHARIHMSLMSPSCPLPTRTELFPQTSRTSCCRISWRIQSPKATTNATATAAATCAAAVARAWWRASGVSARPFHRLFWEVEDPRHLRNEGRYSDE